MALVNDGHHKYGSVDDSERTTSHSSLFPRPSTCSSATDIFLATAVGGQQHPPQQQEKTDEIHSQDGRSGTSRRLAVAVMCGLAFLAGSGVSWSRSSGNQRTAPAAGALLVIEPSINSKVDTPAAETRPSEPSSIFVGGEARGAHDVAPLEFTVANKYTIRDGEPGQDYPWLKDIKLVEPHRSTTLAVVGPREGFDYRWEVRAGGRTSSSGGLGELLIAETGAVTLASFPELHENVVVLEEVDGDGEVTKRLEERVLVKYVRREIRTLMDDERWYLLRAMATLWTERVDDGDGKDIYGEDYADIFAISRLHFKAATNGTCDHFHDGLGFLLSHSLITNTFEHSLQLVNPMMTVPYWDFTLETTAAADVEYDPSQPNTRTQLLDPSFFGSVDLEDHMVKNGQWANKNIPQVKDGNPGFLEPDIYGKLRSPWNTNDRAFISRGVGQTCQVSSDGYLTWPTCKTHYDLLTTNHNFYSWVWDSMGDAHTPVHLWLGGTMDCDVMYNKIGDLVGADIAESLAYLSVGHRKDMFCENIWGCTGVESVDVKPDEIMASGTCGCRDYDLTQGDDYKKLMGVLVFVEYYIRDFSEDIQRQVVQLLCSGVVAFGENSQSSSSMDPMFWPMHGTMERMWQYSVLTGQVEDFTWRDEDAEVTLPDGTTYTEFVSMNGTVCSGHRGSDVFPFGLLDSDTDGFEVKTGIRANPLVGNELPNREALKAFDPRSNSLNYIYDTFKWDHCGPEGYDFDDLWGETKPSPRKEFFESDRPLSAVYTSFKREMAEFMRSEVEEGGVEHPAGRNVKHP